MFHLHPHPIYNNARYIALHTNMLYEYFVVHFVIEKLKNKIK